MRKKILYILLIMPLIAFGQADQKKMVQVSASSDKTVEAKGDSVNINDMIQNQITVARQKEIAAQNAAKKAAVPAVKAIKSAPAAESTVNSSIPLNIILFITGSAFILLFYLFRNYFVRGRREQIELKKNIKLLREEKLFVKTNDKKNVLRGKLVTDTAKMDIKEFAVPLKAKELKLSQGEILLAARIKTYEMAKVCSNKY